MNKKPRISLSGDCSGDYSGEFSRLESLPNPLLHHILTLLPTSKPISLLSHTLFHLESLHRKALTPLHLSHLPSLLRRYPSLSHLSLRRCRALPASSLSCLPGTLKSLDLGGTEVGDNGVREVGRVEGLEWLGLGRCGRVTDLGVGCVAVGCGRIRTMVLEWCVCVGDLGVRLVAVNCRELRSLDLSHVPITEKSLPVLLQLPHLEELYLAGCLGIDDEGLMTITQQCKSLKILDLSNCLQISHDGVASLTACTPNLNQLNLSYCFPITHSTVNAITKLSKLQSLKLDGCQVTSSGLHAIGNSCLPLKELSLSKCKGVTHEALSLLVDKKKELTKLDITCCRNITSASITSIAASCPSLTSLKMESCGLVKEAAFVSLGKNCKFLKELDLTDSEVDDEGLKAISGCSRLSSLKIGICLNISDKGLIHIGKGCRELQELDLYRCVEVTDAGVTAVAIGCPGLQNINLSYCSEITDNSLRLLSKCSKLDTLEIRGCSQVSSLGLSAIAMGCKQIAKIDIKKCYYINDVGMLSLAHFSENLRQINLSYCSVTDVGLVALASISCLQSMTILHVRGLSPNGLATTLMACRGLTKVKLHTAFRSLLPYNLIEHMRARGCIFHWRDKPFQVEVKPSKLWKQESDDIYNLVS